MVEVIRGVEFELEQQALAALDRGDPRRALELLMEAYGSKVYGYCRNMLRDADLAQEVLQTTFLQAFEGFETFRRGSTLRTWLFGIASHRCLDAAKSRGRRWARWKPIDQVEEPLDDSRTPEEVAASREFRVALVACLRKVPKEDRAIILLRYHQGFTYAEMEDLYDASPAALQMRVSRAVKKLKECLEAKGVRR